MALPDDQIKSLVLNAKLLDEPVLAEAERFAVNTELTLDTALIQKGLVAEEKLGSLIAEVYKVPFISLAKISIPPEVFNLVPERFARKHKVIAFERDQEGIRVAMSSPDRMDILESLSKKTDSKIAVYFALQSDIANAFRAYEKDLQKAVDDLLKED